MNFYEPYCYAQLFSLFLTDILVSVSLNVSALTLETPVSDTIETTTLALLHLILGIMEKVSHSGYNVYYDTDVVYGNPIAYYAKN